MAKQYSGNILLRVSPELHEKVAREAFESGQAISDLVAQAMEVRTLLSHLDPWKAIRETWQKNDRATPTEIEADVDEAIASVRARRREKLAAVAAASGQRSR